MIIVSKFVGRADLMLSVLITYTQQAKGPGKVGGDGVSVYYLDPGGGFPGARRYVHTHPVLYIRYMWMFLFISYTLIKL